MKRLIAILLCVVALITPVMAAGDAADDQAFVVGSTTPMTGSFATDAWSLNAADMDVRELIHGYELASWSSAEDTYIMNPTVVKDFTAYSMGGPHTYTIKLHDDLKWSDGSAVTAWDYAFSMLLASAPEVAELGGSNASMSQIQGVDAYSKGKADGISGVTVPDDHTLKITMTNEYEPHFFYLGLFYIKPYPIGEIAPGCTVKSGANGIYIDGSFTAETLKKNLLAEASGYATHPSVVSGPYMLKEYDAKECKATFEINPNFKGDVNGNKPSIEKIMFRYVPSDKVAEEVKNGNVDLMNRVTTKDSIDTLVKEAGITSASYPRSGLSFISFCCEQPTVSTAAVRQAIAYCFDRGAFAEEIVGNYGEVPNGFYGKGQWMVQLLKGELDPPADMKADKKQLLKQLSLNSIKGYAFDPDQAAALLDRYGWKAGEDGILANTVKGEKVKLDLVLAYPEGSSAAEVFGKTLADNLKEIGIGLTLKGVAPDELLRMYYRQDERDCDMIYLATNFNVVYDPAENFALNDQRQVVYNRTGLQDQTLYKLAVDMRKVIPGDLAGYCAKWLDFQKSLMQQLPMIPGYTNDYYDFYVSGLKDYDVSAYQTWSKAIVAASMD